MLVEYVDIVSVDTNSTDRPFLFSYSGCIATWFLDTAAVCLQSVPPWRPGAVPCDVLIDAAKHPTLDGCAFGLGSTCCCSSSTRRQAPHSLRGEGTVAIRNADHELFDV